MTAWHARVDKALAGCSAGIVLVMMLLTTSDVVLRYFFSSPIQGSYELMQFLLVGASALAFSYVQYGRKNIAVTFIVSRLPPKARKVIDIFFLLLILALVGLIFRQALLSAILSTEVGDNTAGSVALPIAPSKWILVVGFAFLGLRVISQALTHFFKKDAVFYES